jgi:PAS domain-containing protein
MNLELERRVRERTRELAESEKRFRSIYNTAPVSIWLEDWAEVIAAVEDLRQQGVADFAAHFREHPEFVTRALNAVKIIDVNQWTLGMFAARSKAEMVASLGTVFATPDALRGFANELLAFAQRQTVYRADVTLNTVKGALIHALLAMSFPPPGSVSGDVLVSVIDITGRKQAEENIQKLNGELQQRALQLEATNQELQRMNKLFVGRELRMAELKEKMRQLQTETAGGVKPSGPGAEEP